MKHKYEILGYTNNDKQIKKTYENTNSIRNIHTLTSEQQLSNSIDEAWDFFTQP